MHPYEVKGPPKVQPGSVFLDAIDKKCKSHTIFIKLYIVIYKETRYKYMYTQWFIRKLDIDIYFLGKERGKSPRLDFDGMWSRIFTCWKSGILIHSVMSQKSEANQVIDFDYHDFTLVTNLDISLHRQQLYF